MNKSGANKATMDAVNAARAVPIFVRPVEYPNTIVKQNHRAIEPLTRPIFNFKSFRVAGSVLAALS